MLARFNDLEQGAKVTLIGVAIAMASLLLPWSIFWGRPQNAFLEGEFLIALPLLYPLIILLLGRKPHYLGSILAIGLPLIAGLLLLSIYYSDPNQDPGAGLYLFDVAGLVGLAGLLKSGRQAN